jgi:hypothetical protein
MAFTAPFEGGEIRYTLDGKEPTPESPRYAAPLRLTDSAVVKAQTFLPTGNASDIAEFGFRKLVPHEPVTVASAAPGLAYAYYEGNWERLPDFGNQTPAATGTATGVDLGVRKRDDNFALRFTGYVEVPTDGIYTFYLNSDDGSRLLIGSEVVVDNDGLHAAVEVPGQVLLKAGRHPIAVEYFQAGGERRLDVSYEGPGVAKQTIPPEVLNHKEKGTQRRGDILIFQKSRMSPFRRLGQRHNVVLHDGRYRWAALRIDEDVDLRAHTELGQIDARLDGEAQARQNGARVVRLQIVEIHAQAMD